MKRVKVILDIAIAILSIITICYSIATRRKGDDAYVIDAEVIE